MEVVIGGGKEAGGHRQPEALQCARRPPFFEPVSWVEVARRQVTVVRIREVKAIRLRSSVGSRSWIQRPAW